MSNILIITNSNDLTVNYIINKYNNHNFYRLDIDKLSLYNISVIESNILITFTNWKISFSEINSIYYRKPRMPDLGAYNPEYHFFMKKDILSFLFGIIDSFSLKCLSKPYILNRAENKTLQLLLAHKIGFNLPNSLITNNSEEFIKCAKNNTCIIKPLSVGKYYYKDNVSLVYTNLLSHDYPMENIELSPIYIQEFIKKDFEVRLTIINKFSVAVKIETENIVDWRKSDSKDVIYSLFNFPEKELSMCFKLMKELNITFGAFDFLVKNNKYYFLEVNPNGQWLWLEEKLNLNISYNIIKYLGE